MRIYTAHLHKDQPPVLLQEGWTVWGALFWPVWLLAQRAWLPGAAVLAMNVAVNRLAPDGVQTVLGLAMAVLVGVLGRDLVRWTLERRGYVLAHVLAARDEEAALGRLLTVRPDLVPGYAERLR